MPCNYRRIVTWLLLYRVDCSFNCNIFRYFAYPCSVNSHLNPYHRIMNTHARTAARILSTVTLLFAICGITLAQRPAYGKMSSWIREIVGKQFAPNHPSSSPGLPSQSAAARGSICAFVRIDGDSQTLFSRYGISSLAHWGNIHIADIPLAQLAPLSLEKQVRRIEAHRSHSVSNDSCAIHLEATQAWAGTNLPQPYTGNGVVVGVMDIGFDLTHPNFYSHDMSRYRIRRFWDQLSSDTVGSGLYVGRDWQDEHSILATARSTDGTIATHGTHTLGTAAGSGFGSIYRGMAYDADICLVSNAVSNNVGLIDSTQLYKFTYATDALGFKYIFDYAQALGKSCVISFSEGSAQDFHGDDQLYYQVLDSLTGPGRIIVAAAGNDAIMPTYIYKERGRERAGNFIFSLGKEVMSVLKSKDAFDIRLTLYQQWNSTDTTRIVHQMSSQSILSAPDSTRTDTLAADNVMHTITIMAYPSCYDPTDVCYDVMVRSANDGVGVQQPISIEITGVEAEVELFRQSGYLYPNPLAPALSDGQATHCINSPSSAPSVISVGATGYRKGAYNYLGQWGETDYATGGLRSYYSSVGPTLDGRMKPEVMAPGSNVISSYSSFYIEANPTARDVLEDVEHFTFNNRTYGWNRNTGTSMACPAAAGVIALWLEACPTLTPQQVKDIIARTSSHPDPTLAYPNHLYGYGQINAYRGLLHITNADRIDALDANPLDIGLTLHDGGGLQLRFPAATTSESLLTIYSTSGTMHGRYTIPAGTSVYDISLAHLQKGIYALQLRSEKGGSGSALIRKR